jgi:ABC-2 type transport system ATP-binding protein
VLDEPANGLDSDGVSWVRGLLRGLAAEGRTVLVTSHLLAEVQQSADHVIVMGRGRVLADRPIGEFVAGAAGAVVLRTPDADLLDRLARVLPQARLEADRADPGAVRVHGAGADQVGEAAHAAGMRVHHLAPEPATLEDAYRRVTGQDVEYSAGRA